MSNITSYGKGSWPPRNNFSEKFRSNYDQINWGSNLSDKEDAFKWRFFMSSYDQIGIYPEKVIDGDKPYEKRNDYMNGWNDCESKLLEGYETILKIISEIDKKDQINFMELLDNSIIYLNITNKGDPYLFVNCNDIFAWGCPDAENLPFNKISELYMYWSLDNNYGPIKWCCVSRNERPQASVAKYMKELGSWNDAMEYLPENHYDIYLKGLKK